MTSESLRPWRPETGEIPSEAQLRLLMPAALDAIRAAGGPSRRHISLSVTEKRDSRLIGHFLDLKQQRSPCWDKLRGLVFEIDRLYALHCMKPSAGVANLVFHDPRLDVRLYCGDARKVLPELGLTAPVVATDAPYRLTAGGAAQLTGQHNTMSGPVFGEYGARNDGLIVPCNISWQEIMGLVDACLADPGDAYVMADARNVFSAHAAAEDVGLRFHNLLVWEKPGGTPNRWYMKNGEFCLYLYKGKAQPIGNCGTRAVIRAPVDKVTGHPTEKPVGLMSVWLVNSSKPGDLVIDPFAGSGTTLVAAMRAGRRAVGVEIDPHFAAVAAERLRREAPLCPGPPEVQGDLRGEVTGALI